MLLLVLAAAGGCLHLSRQEPPPSGRVALYLVAGPGDSRTPSALMRLSTANGKTVIVLRQPLLTSADFMMAESVHETDGGCLKFSLAPQSRYQWMQLCRELVGRMIAVSVDGWMQIQLPLPPPEPTETEPYLTLCGDWSQHVRAAIIQQAPANYQQLKHQIP